jgi:nitrite reductase (NO-forming)
VTPADQAKGTPHTPFPARLAPAPAGAVARVQITLKDVTTEIAPGVKYRTWGFDAGAPGPVVHVRQGQKMEITLTNARSWSTL